MFFRRTFNKHFALKSKQTSKQTNNIYEPETFVNHWVYAGTAFSDISTGSARDKKEVFSADTEQKTELVLHFRFDRSMVDYGYRDNNRILAAMHKIFADSLCVSRIDSVCIQAFSSPEGDADYNRRLALRRAQAVKGYLVWKYPGLNQYRIRTSAQAESWDALRDVALNDTLLPCRDEILQILKLNTGEKRKEALLKKLNTGIPYRHISQWILPELRNASICTVYMRPLRLHSRVAGL